MPIHTNKTCFTKLGLTNKNQLKKITGLAFTQTCVLSFMLTLKLKKEVNNVYDENSFKPCLTKKVLYRFTCGMTGAIVCHFSGELFLKKRKEPGNEVVGRDKII